MQILESSGPLSNCVFEGWVVSDTIALRHVLVKPWSSPKKRPLDNASNDEVLKEDKAVLDLVLGDRTGIITCTLWGEHAQQCHESLMNFKAVSPSSKMILRIKNFSAKSKTPHPSWDGAILSTIKVIANKERIKAQVGSEISIITMDNSASPFLVAGYKFRVPKFPVCVALYASLKNQFSHPPFRCTLSGIIRNKQDVQASTSGAPKLGFALVDETGAWVKCFAMEKHAGNPVLEDNNHVVIFYGCGRSPLGDSPGAIYLLGDSFMVMVAPVLNSVPEMRSEIEIGQV